jgi:hypothetical protein
MIKSYSSCVVRVYAAGANLMPIGLQWIVDGYALVFASLLLSAG